MRRKTWIVLAAVLVLAGTVAGGLYWRWVSSPRYALQQMVLALRAKNMPEFYKYLDLKAIMGSIVEGSSQEWSLPDDPKEDEWTRLSRRLGRKLARSLVPKLMENFDPQIKGVLEQYLLALDNTKILALAAAVTVAKIDTKGDEAQVTLHDPKTGDPLRLRMSRSPETRTWVVVGISYEDFRKFFKREFK
ncbi:MAG: hypothetical protein A2Y80_10495 [Deltaproteobacteria bacterium RBG_13_58_19]|nr:MAG: hypothetical protein A2Y80_10495 [Deltaproteobacteria bacterium RBG_13_58_19]